MGGDITFESEKDKGTTFVITIPFKIDMEKREAEKKAKKSVCSIAGLNILLVEDNELNMEIVEFITQNAGAVVTKAWNGSCMWNCSLQYKTWTLYPLPWFQQRSSSSFRC